MRYKFTKRGTSQWINEINRESSSNRYMSALDDHNAKDDSCMHISLPSPKKPVGSYQR